MTFVFPCLAAALSLAAGPSVPAQTASVSHVGSCDGGREFIAQVNAELKRLYANAEQAGWVAMTYITDDTEALAARAQEELMAYSSQAVADSMKYDIARCDQETARALHLLRVNDAMPAPMAPARRSELAALSSKLSGAYGKGKWCGKDGKGQCRELPELEKVLNTERNWDKLLDAWAGWHTVGAPMKADYARMSALINEGARDMGFADAGTLWRSGYDMAPEAFAAETDRLWHELKPLYDDLHCYVRGKLEKAYPGKMPADGTIPAHLLGNMWAQEWNNIYKYVEPYPGHVNLNVDSALKKQKYDPKKMAKTAEDFFISIGLDPLPATFWERSMFQKPRDRAVVCHASAWDVNFSGDLRIKMCIEPTEEDLITLHHELGHLYYYHAYDHLPVLFQSGANDGFHEAIGDAIALSMTPAHFKELGLLKKVPEDEKALINVQMKAALEKIAFLPFGLMIDQWRWKVFSGEVTPENYNEAWWKLRHDYQGVSSPDVRPADAFDPGAKYHIPAGVPYMRYFLARILQFQFHKALCDAAGFQGPLHKCSIYGNKAAGAKLNAMLKMGASRPWPDALEAVDGTRRISTSAILEYFQPLQKWLREQNKGKTCGWK